METGKTLFDGIQNRKQTIVNQITNGFEKAHVKQHTRTTKSGKMVNVTEHEDKRASHNKKMLKKLQGEGKNFDGNYYIDQDTKTIRHSYYSDSKVQSKIDKLNNKKRPKRNN